MKLPVVNKENKHVDDIEVNDVFFGIKWNPRLVHQVVKAEQNNKRSPWAHAKTRAEVSGGGKKPWRQKHTGRARHGSTRSPIWVHGGSAHGPNKARLYEEKINKKMRQAALFSVLSKKVADAELKVIDTLEMEQPKTKNAIKTLGLIFGNEKQSALVITKIGNRSAQLSVRNAPRKEAVTANALSTYNVLKHKYILFEKTALTELESHFKSRI